MTQYAIVTDLNQCTGCLACMTACKMANGVPIGNYWTKTLRIGPNPMYEGAQNPDVELYYLPVGCQHCENPACVNVCPTEASHKLADGTVQVDKSKCIGCQFCAMACPYGVRYLNEEEKVVEKCTLCEQKTAQGGLPQCVINCGGRARWFGDLEAGIDSFEALDIPQSVFQGLPYEEMMNHRTTFGEYAKPYGQDDIHHLPDVGNKPSFVYILRNRTWRG